MIILDLLVVFLFYCGLMYAPVISIILLIAYYCFNPRLILTDFLAIFLFLWIGSIEFSILFLIGYIWLKYKNEVFVNQVNKLVKDITVKLIDFLVIFTFLINIVDAPLFSILFALGYFWLRNKYHEYEEKLFLNEVIILVNETYNEFCNLTVGSSKEIKFNQYLLLRESIESTLDIDENRRAKVLELVDKKFKGELMYNLVDNMENGSTIQP